MTEKEIKYFTINYINQKIKENEEFIKYTFYELRIKSNLSEKEVDEFLKINRNYFENKGYDVYFTGAKYVYNNKDCVVQENELMVAIKDNNY